MSGFLRADWIRFRHRRDVLVIALALPVLAVVGYASGLTSSGNQFSFDPDFSPPPEILAAMAAERQRFAFPQSVLTLLGSTGIGLLALVYLAVATVGDEFGWSTIRLSLLASSAAFIRCPRCCNSAAQRRRQPSRSARPVVLLPGSILSRKGRGAPVDIPA